MMLGVRTTVTLDEDVAAALAERVRERGESFKTALNETLRAGLASGRRPRAYRVPAKPLGMRPDADLDHALSLAARLEDEEIARKLELRK